MYELLTAITNTLTTFIVPGAIAIALLVTAVFIIVRAARPQPVSKSRKKRRP